MGAGLGEGEYTDTTLLEKLGIPFHPAIPLLLTDPGQSLPCQQGRCVKECSPHKNLNAYT